MKFRPGNKTLDNFLSHSLFSSELTGKIWLSQKGFFKCGGARCDMCNLAWKTKKIPILNCSSSFQIKSFVNYSAHHMVYIIHCTQYCVNYMGCAIRKLKNRVLEHLYSIGRRQINHLGACKHFVEIHDGDIGSLGVYARRLG